MPIICTEWLTDNLNIFYHINGWNNLRILISALMHLSKILQQEKDWLTLKVIELYFYFYFYLLFII